jgi:hypothetical protein
MFFWNSKKVDEKIAQLDAKLVDSFNRVKQDTAAIYQWLNFFYDEVNRQKSLVKYQKQLIDKMEGQLEGMPQSREEVKEIVDSYYDHEALLERVRHIAEKIEHLETAKKAPLRAAMREGAHTAKPVSALREKMIKKITRNSKDYIKSVILSVIRKYGRISAMALREIVVDEQGLCSKSSFYRLLEEIEKESEITVLSSGREKVYISELPKHARK